MAHGVSKMNDSEQCSGGAVIWLPVVLSVVLVQTIAILLKAIGVVNCTWLQVFIPIGLWFALITLVSVILLIDVILAKFHHRRNQDRKFQSMYGRGI